MAPNAAMLVEGDPGVALEGVSLVFEARGVCTTALDDVSFSSIAKTVTCIIGPSGCGKTTVLRLVAGFLSPSSGTITVDGRAVNSPGPDRLMVFQSPVLFPWLTAQQNLELGRNPLESHSVLYSGVFEEVGLQGFERSYPYQLSGGMRQRLQLARALVLRSKVLLLDEPFGALDAQTRLRMQRLLEQVFLAHRPTLLMVTHDVDEALLLADKIIVMSARPGQVSASFEVKARRPRGLDDLMSAELVQVKAEILKLLKLVR